MRTAFLLLRFALLPSALLTNACATHAFANGTVSYTSTPQTGDHSGALPLTSLVCLRDRDGLRPNAGVRLGGCTLTGIYEAHHGRYAPSGGESSLNASGECAVPTLAGPVPLRVQSSTLQITGDAVDLAVGGATNDGRYLTYRFTGMLSGDAPSAECDAMLNE